MRPSAPAMLLACLVLAPACQRENASTPPPELREDARVLTEAMIEDAAVGALAEVDGAVEDGKPTQAAELLATGAIPAARRQVERVSALEMRTSEGVALRRQALDAYRSRVSALEGYREALRRGEVEDLLLTDALRAQRQAEEAVAAALEAVESQLAP